jgi:hypothetical protein
MPQLQEENNNFIPVQDGVPPHWYLEIRNYLDEKLSRRWIGRSAAH